MRAKDFYQLIFSHVSQILHDEKEFHPTTQIIFRHFIADEFALLLNKDIVPPDEGLQKIFIRLRQDEPIQYILQEAFFLDMQLFVDKNVLIPRPETEEMVLDVFQNISPKIKNVLDIGTGSGCIALALKKKFPHLEVDALDISSNALSVAQQNVQRHALKINFIHADIFQMATLPKRYDLIISNPPYVCCNEKISMEKRVLDFEPHEALFVEDTVPLIFYEKIVSLARENFGKGGLLFLEINEKFGEETAKLMFDWENVTINKDIKGKDRWIRASL